ncbi:PilZ domain-containing protein [Thiomicrorhabdus xiamenensis]|uniref:PilZ domain-containing protein n=1 Tax=Thiomicrorhabdus xiamenensis TaxID=2739063 RepID=A0A7D4T1H7_9GAMM|nr:PilZ domain-containing protein [Thiomicrorhabdus xiamenensis]QKI89942.1 PilZ domain-containing protein [Thiomicrorhabdus xiamenensis]
MLKNAHGSERRCSPRIAINLPVSLECNEHVLECKLIDISMCGIGLISNATLPVCTPAIIRLKLPNEDGFINMKLQAKITRCTKIREQYLIGLQFVDLSSFHEYELSAFFSYHSRFSA